MFIRFMDTFSERVHGEDMKEQMHTTERLWETSLEEIGYGG